MIDFKAISPRLYLLCVTGKFCNYSIFSAHAPTETSPDEEKEEFYDLLERSFYQCPRYDIKVIAGDLNEKVGRE